MRNVSHLFACTCLLASSTVALSAASQQEADSVKAALEKLLTSTPGVVSVIPKGDSYDLTIDPAPLLAKAKSADATVTISPHHFTVTPLGNGKWQFKIDEPASYGFKLAGGQSFDVNLGKVTYEGEFDETLGALTKSGFQVIDYQSLQNTSDPSGTKTFAKGNIAEFKGNSVAVANPGGGVDVTSNYTSRNWKVDNEVSGPGQPGLAFTYEIGSSDYDSTGNGVRQKEILGLLAWFVARPSVDLITQDQESLRTTLRSVLPYAERIAVQGRANSIAVATPFGNATLDSVGLVLDMHGLVKNGKLREQISFAGLSLPPGVTPPWSAGLVPTGATIDFTLTGFDPAAAANHVIDKFDLTKSPSLSAADQAALPSLWLPTGILNLKFEPNQIKSGLYEINMDGDFKISMVGMPTGKANIRMKGFDATMQALQAAAASDPSAQQAMGPLLAAKGFARIEGDEFVWSVETTAIGGILVNGIDVTKM